MPNDGVAYSGRMYNANRLNTILQEENSWANEANATRMGKIIITVIICIVIFGVLIYFAVKNIRILATVKPVVPTTHYDYFRDLPRADATPAEALYILNEKINGSNNLEIREGLIKFFGVDHTQEYISSLYRNKIPQTIANQATENWIDNIYMNKLKGNYKRCSRCKEIKLANNRNFSINKTSSSQFYSICKSCRNQKNK